MSYTGATEGLGVLVIYAWRESDAQHPFRARVTYGSASDEAPDTVFTTDLDDVVNTVRRWLTEVSASGRDH